MALGRALSAAIVGVTATIVDVEANVGPGLPRIQIVGLADTAISESRDRMKTAVANSQLHWPKTKVVVSLSPASMPKAGSHFDVAMCLAILTASSTDPLVRQRLSETVLLGEVGLDGSLRPVAGVLPVLMAARRAGLRRVIVPQGNAAEAALIDVPVEQKSGTPPLSVLAARSLAQIMGWVNDLVELPSAVSIAEAQGTGASESAEVRDMADVYGQPEARWAAEVAAAGGHHMMMVGPPGTGKSMIAARLPGLLPPLDAGQCVEATAVHSVAGGVFHGPVLVPPFVAPHYSVSRSALLGGGSGMPRPGAVSLAHHGVLFLDEASEIPASVLDSLRTPLEEGEVRLVRARHDVHFPARFQLVLAANPCPCGAEDPSSCRCLARVRMRHLSNISGPLRDRLDIFVHTRGVGAVLGHAGEESTASIRERVVAARERSVARWSRAGVHARSNRDVDSQVLRREFPADDAAMALLAAYLGNGDVSQRGVDRMLKLAWTIADLAGASRPGLDHVAQAFELHGAPVEVAA